MTLSLGPLPAVVEPGPCGRCVPLGTLPGAALGVSSREDAEYIAYFCTDYPVITLRRLPGFVPFRSGDLDDWDYDRLVRTYDQAYADAFRFIATEAVSRGLCNEPPEWVRTSLQPAEDW